MKIIFLDVDGVLNSHRSIYAYKGCPMPDRDWQKLDFVAIGLIQRLVEDTGAKVVLSSTWRLEAAYNRESDYLQRLGTLFGVEIIDHTPVINSFRGDEILAWLEDNTEFGIENYVIVDDDSDFHDHQKPHFVKVDREEGFSFANFRRAQELLGGKVPPWEPVDE